MNSLPYIFIYIAAALIFYFMAPQKWHNKPMLLFCLLGFLDLSALLLLLRYIENVFLRNLLIYSSTIYFGIFGSGIVVGIFRFLFIYIAIRLKHHRLAQLAQSSKMWLLMVFLFSSICLGFGIYNFAHPIIKEYDISLADNGNEMKIAFISDLHLGAGMSEHLADLMTDMLKENACDLLLIGGDVIDATSRREELDYLCQKLKSLDIDIFYTSGNHEKDSFIDITKIFEQADISCLYDDYINIGNLNIVGLTAADKQIEIANDDPSLVITHIPRNIKNINVERCLVISGHTHGYQFPSSTFYVAANDCQYGYKQIEDKQLIVSSGISAWGFRSKFPSRSEILIIKLKY